MRIVFRDVDSTIAEAERWTEELGAGLANRSLATDHRWWPAKGPAHIRTSRAGGEG